MTSALAHGDDDDDSLYDHPIIKPPANVPSETILPEHHALHIDTILDSEETPPSSPEPSGRASISSLPDSTSAHNDDIFDSDENRISTSSSSSASSSTTIPERPPRHIASSDKPAARPAPSFLSRASATFYKAFRKKKPAASAPPSHALPPHDALVRLFDAQIATLRSARTGFVDLALATGLTSRALEGVAHARLLLREFARLENRAAALRRRVDAQQRAFEHDIAAKEALLVHAKISLAEAAEHVERLRHELRCVRKVLADPRRKDRRKVRLMRREAAVCREARKDVEMRLAEKTTQLEHENSQLSRVENHFRDIEGDWA